ncbi:MAG: tetratricopeptide repeat protein [Candidatus Krumholzibacteria bacterium]|nr:tetratricopeptide repeat protein [Candidatus Krumholzibacteria bacterium]
MRINRSAKRWFVFVCLLAALAAASSCERQSVLEKTEEEYAKGNYREAVFIARHHFRRGGERTPELLFVTGKAMLRLGNEADASDCFAEAYSIDSTWAPRIAQELRAEALSSFGEGLAARGQRFILLAIGYRAEIDFGQYDAVAGTLLLERGDFDGAIKYLGRYLASHPDTAGTASVMLDLGAAYEGTGETLRAIELYTEFRERYPKSRLGSTATYRLETLLLESGEEMITGGDRDEARRILEQLVAGGDNPLVREKSNFLLGEIAEADLDIERALRYYREVVHLNLGSSGRLVERAKERIERLEAKRTE